MEENKVRYSDEELEEFRQLINAKLAVAQADYEILIKKINGDGEEDEAPHSTYHTLEEGSETLSKESLMNECMRAQKFITGLGSTGAHPEQDLRHLPRDGQADSQGTPSCCAPRHPFHRSQAGSRQEKVEAPSHPPPRRRGFIFEFIISEL